MRSSIIPAFAKVEGHVSLTRDMSSHAIICNDDEEYEAYKRRNNAAKNHAKILTEQNNQIQHLKSEVEEMKQMLAQILKGK
jgi:hypothetical protein